MKVRYLLEGIGAALFLSPDYFPLLSPSNITLYHHGFPVTNVVGGLLLYLLGLALLLTILLVANDHLPTSIRGIFPSLLAALILWRVIDVIFRFEGGVPMAWWLHWRMRNLIVIVLLSVILPRILPKFNPFAVRALRLMTAACAFTALWIVPQLIHIALIRQSDEAAAFNHGQDTALKGPSRRIIWILFDELSFDQTFDHPVAGIELPNFDRMRSESVSFSDLTPAGYNTEDVIPSLFAGRPIYHIRSTVHGDLWYKDEAQNRWIAFDPDATLFGLAQRNGWSSGIDGWFNPYCHMLAHVLTSCSWEPDPQIVPGESEDKSILANAAGLPKSFVTNREMALRNAHLKEYRSVMARTHALINDEQFRFVFLHIPVPHPPGIYNRQLHQLGATGTYLDNLVLADDTLGELLKEINATPSSNETTVIVSSDHSWRIDMWKPQAGWSVEEERASKGYFDERPFLLIHFPGQNSGHDVNSALPTLMEHDIIADMLLNKLNSPGDLTTFLAPREHPVEGAKSASTM